MIKFIGDFEVEDGHTFADHDLLISAVSVGNVGQLAVDVILANSGPSVPRKIGRIFHPAIEAVVGTDPCKNNGDASSLVTSCEIFLLPEKKCIIIHFHSPVIMKKRAEFIQFFCDWIKQQNFKQVVCFSSSFAAERNDHQLAGVPFRFLATENCDTDMLEGLRKLDWEPLEKRQFPAPAIIDDNQKQDSETGVLYLPGGGITLQMFETCKENKIPFLAMIMFASEGDNTPEALTMFEAANNLFSFTKKGSTGSENGDLFENVNIPLTWGHFHGRSHPVEMY